MKKSIINLLAFSFALSIAFTACKKKDDTVILDNTSEVSTQTDDQSRVSAETESVTNDVNGVLETAPTSIKGRLEEELSVICDGTVVTDSLSDPRTITITYNGSSCKENKTRTGVVVIAVAKGTQWKTPGAVATITYKDVKITRISDNKSVILNGTHTITNVSGGLLVNLPQLQSIKHTTTSANMSITFDDGTKRTWQVAKQRVFTYNNGVVITTTGTHAANGETTIAEWGNNRAGKAFTNSTVEPLVIRQDCSFRLVSGKTKHITPTITSTVTYGLDKTGNVTTCPGTGSYYLKAAWTGPNGNTISAIMPY